METQPDRRATRLDVRVVGELLLCIFILPLMMVWLAALFGSRAIWFLPLLVAAIGRSMYRRWRSRSYRWHLLTDWRSRPLRREGTLVVQEDSAGRCIGQIDTKGHYTVRWERFDSVRALYLVSQGTQTVTISTLSPDAPALLIDALRVKNYPCEDWPNLDL